MFVTLASLNNNHSFDLRACCVGMRFLSRPNLVPVKPLRPRNVAWWSSLIANLSNTTLGCAFVVGGGGLHSRRLLLCGGDDLGMQLHLALRQLCVEPLHQLFLNLALLGLKALEAQVELVFFLFRHVDQGLHSPVDHLAHVLSHHRGPLGLFCRHSLGCDS